MAHREKVSTTIAPENYGYLASMVKRRKARTLAEALDLALGRIRALDNRARLERDTAAYFAALSGKAAAEEARLEAALAQAADEVDFDERPDA